MFLTIQSYKSEERKHESAHALSFVCSVLLCLIILTGCDNLNNKQQNSVVKPKGDVTPADVAEMTKPSSNNTVKEVIPYARTSVKHRIGKRWKASVETNNS